jgi:cell fate regulator YaaT (PSP1 superfamily)
MIYEIKFMHGEANVFAESQLEFPVQTKVIIRSEKGQFYGKIIREIDEKTNISASHQLIREVTEDDLDKINHLEEAAEQVKKESKNLVASQNLEMKIIDAAYNFDQSQLFIAFTAEKRVDFRVLLREMAAKFKTRIELRQIGPRDATKVLGGVGACGLPLCCSEFIYEFPNVSIKMAKNQNLSLKQSKLNGLCGRLLCCLSYEDEFYREAQRNFPDFGEVVVTDEGKGKVVGLNVLKNSVKIRFEEYSKEFDLAEIGGSRG